MTKKKRILRELLCFISVVLAGIILSFIFYKVINVDIDLAVVAAGVVVVLLAVYVVRITLWVFKQNM